MPGGERGRDTGRTKHGDGGHGRSDFTRDDFRHTSEVGTICVVQLDREFKVTYPINRPYQVIDRVVRYRPRAMTAGIGRFQYEVLRSLFRCKNPQGNAMALRIQIAIDALGQSQFRVRRNSRPLLSA